MDAKWNKVVDNFAVRTGMLVLGFGVWLAISYVVLAALGKLAWRPSGGLTFN